MLTPRENYLRCIRGEVPEYVPRYSEAIGLKRPSILYGGRLNGAGIDIYGVDWVTEGSAFDAPIPKSSDFILTDITKWRDVIKFPDFSGVDWERMAKKDRENIDPALVYGGGCAAQGFFQSVMAFMGFTEGLMAIIEEPEEVRALIEYLCDSYLSLADKFLRYYKPDFIHFADDIAAERSPFISLDSFREIFAPVWRRYISYFKERGYLAQMHNCGHFELFLEDTVDMGFNIWDPAQVSNDLTGIKQRYGNSLIICGGFNSNAFLPYIDVTEEDCRAAVRRTLDELAPGGGYIFAGGAGLTADPASKQRTEWIMDEYEKLKRSYY
jgi:hypothetical protein